MPTEMPGVLSTSAEVSEAVNVAMPHCVGGYVLRMPTDDTCAGSVIDRLVKSRASWRSEVAGPAHPIGPCAVRVGGDVSLAFIYANFRAHGNGPRQREAGAAARYEVATRLPAFTAWAIAAYATA